LDAHGFKSVGIWGVWLKACRLFGVQALSLQALGAYGFKPEGLAQPLPGSKAPVFVAHEIERPKRPTHQLLFDLLVIQSHGYISPSGFWIPSGPLTDNYRLPFLGSNQGMAINETNALDLLP
jgi:hypothetical protein